MRSIELTEYARGGGKTEKDAVSRYYRCAAPGNRGSGYNNLTEDQLSDTVHKKFYSDMPTIWRVKEQCPRLRTKFASVVIKRGANIH